MSLRLEGAGLVHPNGHRALQRVSLPLGARRARRRRSARRAPARRRCCACSARRSGRAKGASSSATTTRGGSARATLRRLRARIGVVHQSPPIPPRLRVVTAVLAGRLGRLAGVEGAGLAGRSRATPPARATRSPGSTSASASSSAATGSRAASCSASASPACCTSGPTCILADEPVSALDPTLADLSVGALVAESEARGATLVASLHAVDLALKWFPRLIGMKSGEIVFDRPTAAVTSAMLHELYATEGRALPGRASPRDRRRTRPANVAGAQAAGMPMSAAERRRRPRADGAAARSRGARDGRSRCVVAVVVLWPLLVLAEFRPWQLFASGNLQVMANFLAGFLPPSTAPDFLALLWQGDARDAGDRHGRHRPRVRRRRAARGASRRARSRSRASARARAAQSAPPCARATRGAADRAARDPRGRLGAGLRARARPRPGRRRARARGHLRRHARQGLHRDPRIGRHAFGARAARSGQPAPGRALLRARAEHRARSSPRTPSTAGSARCAPRS